MRTVIQRVNYCKLIIDNELYSEIKRGFLVLLGIEQEDSFEDLSWLCQKVINMRIFSDKDGKMNLSLLDINGEIMIVSQFTLHSSTKKGNRPSFLQSAKPDKAIPLYESFVQEIKKQYKGKVVTGVFGADMQIELLNDGPVTIFMDSKNKE
jgi:D-tyrosyl-tRNA(Tyr) deacylase